VTGTYKRAGCTEGRAKEGQEKVGSATLLKENISRMHSWIP
jgi:hypothetical protein